MSERITRAPASGQKLRVEPGSAADRQRRRTRQELVEPDDASAELLTQQPAVERRRAARPGNAEVVVRRLVEERRLALLVLMRGRALPGARPELGRKQDRDLEVRRIAAPARNALENARLRAAKLERSATDWAGKQLEKLIHLDHRQARLRIAFARSHSTEGYSVHSILVLRRDCDRGERSVFTTRPAGYDLGARLRRGGGPMRHLRAARAGRCRRHPVLFRAGSIRIVDPRRCATFHRWEWVSSRTTPHAARAPSRRRPTVFQSVGKRRVGTC